MSTRDTDAEILALRHQIIVLQRQLGETRPRFHPTDRMLLAALLHRLPLGVLRNLRLLVRPDTALRRHRDLFARRHDARSRTQTPGPALCTRSAPWCYAWSGRTRAGAIGGCTASWSWLGIAVAASTIWEILHDAGSTRHPNERPLPRPTSSDRRPTRCWPATSSRRSPRPGPECTCSR
jgi:putative transposase